MVILNPNGFSQEKEKIFIDTLHLLFNQGKGALLEGPSFSPAGKLYFSDLSAILNPGSTTGIIWKLDIETKEASVYRSPSGHATGMFFDADGQLVVCEGPIFGGRRITKTDINTGLSTQLAGLFNGKPFNGPNDVVIDEHGRIYFTDPKFYGHEIMLQPVHGVYMIDTALNTKLIIADIRKPNGIMISPDQKTLYISTSDNVWNDFLGSNYDGDRIKMSGSLLAYDLDDHGNAKFRSKIVDFGGSFGDGMTTDLEGNIYVAHPNRRKLSVYTPGGEKIDELTFPVGPVTNATFGQGLYNSTLFITAGRSIYYTKTSKKGYSLAFRKK